jgi:hypothetical protein
VAVASVARVELAPRQAVSEKALFFGLLVVATAFPYLLLPLSAHVFTRSMPLEASAVALLFIGSQAHVAASFFFYGDPQARAFMLGERRVRFLIVPVAIVTLSTVVVFLLAGGQWLGYYVLGYWIWQTHHYTRQNHGILSFVSRAEAVPVTARERIAVTLTGIAGVIGMITVVTPYEATVLRAYGWHIRATALGIFVCGWAIYLATLHEADRTPSRLRSLLMAMLMLFYLPLFCFSDDRSAVFTYAIAHGLQYLVFMYFVAATPTGRRWRAVGALVALALLGGAILKLPELAGSTFGHINSALIGASLGVVMWHFVLDAGMWKLSEPFQRSYMARRFSFLAARR